MCSPAEPCREAGREAAALGSWEVGRGLRVGGPAGESQSRGAPQRRLGWGCPAGRCALCLRCPLSPGTTSPHPMSASGALLFFRAFGVFFRFTVLRTTLDEQGPPFPFPTSKAPVGRGRQGAWVLLSRGDKGTWVVRGEGPSEGKDPRGQRWLVPRASEAPGRGLGSAVGVVTLLQDVCLSCRHPGPGRGPGRGLDLVVAAQCVLTRDSP